MARRYSSNPDIPFLGVDFFDALEVGVGAAGVALGNDKFVTPIAKNLLGGAYANETTAKIMDTITTIATGAIAAKVTSMFSRQIASRVAMGAAILAVPKLVSIVVPGFFLNAGLPSSFTFANPFAQKAIATGNGGTPLTGANIGNSGAQTLALIGVGSSMGI